MEKIGMALKVPVEIKNTFDTAVSGLIGESKTDLIVKFMDAYIRGLGVKEYGVPRGTKVVMTNFEVPKDLKEKFKTACKANDKTMTAVLVSFMANYGK